MLLLPFSSGRYLWILGIEVVISDIQNCQPYIVIFLYERLTCVFWLYFRDKEIYYWLFYNESLFKKDFLTFLFIGAIIFKFLFYIFWYLYLCYNCSKTQQKAYSVCWICIVDVAVDWVLILNLTAEQILSNCPSINTADIIKMLIHY